MKFLIVDDSPANLKLLRAQLEAEGHEVVQVTNGIEALKELGCNAVDVVISDILMPGMDGYRLCYEIRTGGGDSANIPIVLYTATYVSSSDRALAEMMGGDFYLLKPAPIGAIIGAANEAKKRREQWRSADVTETDRAYVLEQYSVELVHKLELRNAELQDALAILQGTQEQVLEMNQQLEQRVEQRTVALTAANRELENFSCAVSHDLRAPLSSIAGYAQLLEECAGPQLIPEHRAHLAQIIDASRRMSQIIDALLRLARIGVAELRLVEVDLEMVLDQALNATGQDTEGRNIQWLRARLPRVCGDAILLRQVFGNLISNAIKYTRTRDPAVIEIGARNGRQDETVVFVRDNGIGFDMKHAGRLFGTFQRLHGSREFEGLGIGLANAHRIVTRLGGSVWAEAKVDRGATFFFSLPKLAAE